MSKVLKVVAVVATIGAAVATGGLSLGVSAALLSGIATAAAVGASLLAKKPSAPQSSQENIDRLRANVDPQTPRKTVIGNTAFATDIRDEEFTDDQTYFHRFIVCASHAVESIDEIWFDDQRVWTSGGGVEGDAVGYLDVATRTEGTAGNAINISTRMGTTRRYTGMAYVHLKYKLTGNNRDTDSPYAQSITTRITIRGKGAALPDPRDEAQDMEDQSTWAWDDDASRNPALALLFYLLGYKINGLLAVGKGIPVDRIDLDSFITAANICDESVSTFGGGTEPRYRCDGVWSESDSPTTILDTLKACMNADLDDVGGKLRLTVFYNDLASPVADFTDGDIIDAFTWEPQPALDQTFNVVRGVYTDASDTGLYQQVDYPEQSETSPDGIDRISTFNLPMVQSADQAQRLAALRLARQSYAGIFTAEFQATAWKVTKNSVIRLTFAQTGFTTKLFRVAEIEVRQDGTVPLVLREENAAIYADPTLTAPVSPVASTPFDPTLNPLIQAIDQGAVFLGSVAPISIQADSEGVTSTALPITRNIKLYQGTSEVTTSATWSVASASGGITASIGAATGVLSVSVADAAGVITVNAVFGGVTYPTTVVVTRTVASASAGGGSGSSSFTYQEWANISTTSDVQITPVGAIVQSDGSGELRYSASASYAGDAAAIIKAQYSTSSDTGPWSDFASEVTGTAASLSPEQLDGYVSIAAATKTGLSATTDHYVRLIARRSTGSGTLSWADANFTVSQP